MTAFFALAMTGELDLVSMLLYPAALAACFYADVRQVTRLRLREWMWRALALLDFDSAPPPSAGRFPGGLLVTTTVGRS